MSDIELSLAFPGTDWCLPPVVNWAMIEVDSSAEATTLRLALVREDRIPITAGEPLAGATLQVLGETRPGNINSITTALTDAEGHCTPLRTRGRRRGERDSIEARFDE